MTPADATVELEQERPSVQLEPSRLWILGVVIDDDGRTIGPATVASYLEPCGCPGDCGRDHANE